MTEQITSKKKWEAALLAAYIDYTWHQILDPLYDKMQLWKAGSLEHDDIYEAVNRVQQEVKEGNNLLRLKRDFVISIIQANEDFFKPWLAGHPAPPSVVIKE